MANNSINRGLDAEWAQGPVPICQRYGPVTTSGSLFVNSAYVKNASGVPVACGVLDTSPVTGSIKIIYSALGIPITNVATATAIGGAEGSNDPNQRFRILLSAASTYATAIDANANLAAETGTVGSNTSGLSLAANGTCSQRLLDQGTLVAFGTQRMFNIMQLGNDQFASDITAANCELYVRINAANYQP